MQNRTRWPYIDRNAKRQIFRMHLQGTKSGGLFGKTHGGNYARRAAGTLLIHFTMPFDELLCEILLIVEAAHFDARRGLCPSRGTHAPDSLHDAIR